MSDPAATQTMPFAMERLGAVMKLDPDNPDEAWGVLNPAGVRSQHDGEYYLFPRVVAEGNYSRIGIARTLFDDYGIPLGVERMGYALEPDRNWENNGRTGGCEDARTVWIADLGLYLMTYTAYTARGPRIALAVSEDIRTWTKIGLARFAPAMGCEFDLYDNKDALIFPEPVPGPDGEPAICMIHRPDFEIADPNNGHHVALPDGVDDPRPSMWISWCPLSDVKRDIHALRNWSEHRLLAAPEADWEHLKIGGGTPPVRTDIGWVTYYHGVSGRIEYGVDLQRHVHYQGGVMVLSLDDPSVVTYRSPDPILAPQHDLERHGTVDNVVFPTAVDARADNSIDVYYGMADAAIGVARSIVPERLP